MKLWVMSDLHAETTNGHDVPIADTRPDFDVLIVAGDLIPRMERGVRWLRDRVRDKPAIYVAGNHEFYRADIDRTIEKARDTARGTNIHVLQDDKIEIGGVRFIGGTLWTDFALHGDVSAAMSVAAAEMNDYRYIRKERYGRRLRPVDTLARHLATASFIDGQLAVPFDGPQIVVTHHAPHRGALKETEEHEIISAAYASDLADLMLRRQPTLWIYGHTHCSADVTIGATRVVSNPKGYGPFVPGRRTSENAAFDPLFTVHVGRGGAP